MLKELLNVYYYVVIYKNPKQLYARWYWRTNIYAKCEIRCTITHILFIFEHGLKRFE